LGRLRIGEDRAIRVGASQKNGETDGSQHEEDGRVGRQLGEQVRGAARAEGRLRALAAEGTGKISGFALLEEHYADKEERDDDVEDYDKIDHQVSFATSGFLELLQNDRQMTFGGAFTWIGAEEGT
jgi:hypothetical protein